MEKIYTPEELAELLKVKPETVRRYLRSGELTGFKVGQDWRITSDALESFIKAREVKKK